MATAEAQWLIERGVVDPRRLREMPSVKRRRFEEIAEAIGGESLGTPPSINSKATWQVLLEEETQVSGAKWYDLKGRWAAGCEAIFNDTLHWMDPMWNHDANRGGSERSGVKRPVRRLEILFGSKVYKIGTLDLEAA